MKAEMDRYDLQARPGDLHHLVLMTEAAVSNQDIAQLAKVFLKGLANMAEAPAALVYLGDARLSPSLFCHVGLTPEAAPVVQEACAEEFCRLLPDGYLPGPPYL